MRNDLSFVEKPQGTDDGQLFLQNFYFLPPELKAEVEVLRHVYLKHRLHLCFILLKSIDGLPIQHLPD